MLPFGSIDLTSTVLYSELSDLADSAAGFAVPAVPGHLLGRDSAGHAAEAAYLPSCFSARAVHAVWLEVSHASGQVLLRSGVSGSLLACSGRWAAAAGCHRSQRDCADSAGRVALSAAYRPSHQVLLPFHSAGPVVSRYRLSAVIVDLTSTGGTVPFTGWAAILPAIGLYAELAECQAAAAHHSGLPTAGTVLCWSCTG
jgi:hypothetical protein